MGSQSILNTIRGKLIVSCQALEHEPLHGSHIMARMAVASQEGGAVAIRANSGNDIRAIKEATGLPVIGIVKRFYEQCEVFITPTLKEVEEVVQAGAEIVAVDATKRPRPDGSSTNEFIRSIKKAFPEILIMADVAILEEGVLATEYGADLVATTLSGYTSYSPERQSPDFDLIENLVKQVTIPVIAEGHIWTPEELVMCYDKGAWSVVIGSAITRPQEITKYFVERLERGGGVEPCRAVNK